MGKRLTPESKRTPARIAKLAHSIAGGSTPTRWARENKLEPRTVRNWARLPECKALVADIRQRVTERVVGKLTRAALGAVDVIKKLAHSGEQEGVRLSAARSLLEQLLAVSNHVKSEKQIAELTSRITELEASLENPSSNVVQAE
jgi:hypothetical protein